MIFIPHGHSVIGPCSICGGPVTCSPTVGYAVRQCASCGAHPAEGYGPVIAMRPAPTIVPFYETGSPLPYTSNLPMTGDVQ